MNKKRMPVIFSGHGSPMLALEDTSVTRGLHSIGSQIREQFGKPKAILAVSAHWYTKGTFVQSTEKPKQVYDMYGWVIDVSERGEFEPLWFAEADRHAAISWHIILNQAPHGAIFICAGSHQGRSHHRSRHAW